MDINSTLKLLSTVLKGNIYTVPDKQKTIELHYVDGDYLEAPIVTETLELDNEIVCKDGVIRTNFCERNSTLYIAIDKEED